MIKAIAVDDEPLALNVIRIFCDKLDTIDLCTTFSNGVDALKYIKENKIDLIFLDINMPHLNGVEFAKIVDKNVMIIFTTAYQDYAVEGFELDALDYLLKPFPFDRFKMAVQRAESHLALLNSNVTFNVEQGSAPFIMIRSDYATVRVELTTIISIEGLKDYVKIYTVERNYVTKITMKVIEQHLVPHGFMRIHKSYIVNLSKIISFENNHVLFPNNIKISLGNMYRSVFISYLDKNMIL